MADLLAIGAHPDDVEMCCGGLLIRCVSQGRRVVVVDLTRGEMGTRGTPEQRAAEAADATRVLGIAERENLDLGDTRVEVGRRGLEAIVDAIRRHRPEILVAPATSDFHPDHAAAGQLAKSARYLAGVARILPELHRFRPRLLLQYPMHEHPAPSLIVDISEQHATKVKAIRCYRSQLHDAASGEPETMISSATFLDDLIARDRYHGARIGVLYGEPYLLAAPPRISDVFELLP